MSGLCKYKLCENSFTARVEIEMGQQFKESYINKEFNRTYAFLEKIYLHVYNLYRPGKLSCTRQSQLQIVKLSIYHV